MCREISYVEIAFIMRRGKNTAQNLHTVCTEHMVLIMCRCGSPWLSHPSHFQERATHKDFSDRGLLWSSGFHRHTSPLPAGKVVHGQPATMFLVRYEFVFLSFT